MMPTSSSLLIQRVVVIATCGAMSDDKVGIMMTFGFQWESHIMKSPSFECKINGRNGSSMNHR